MRANERYLDFAVDCAPRDHSSHALSRLGRWFDGLRHAVAERRLEARRRWLRYTTERAISELPPELRKDIGWPSRYEC